MLAIELNDAGITAVEDGTIRLQTPGYALLNRNGVSVGDKALRKAFLKPSQVYNRFWDQLSTDPIPFNNKQARSHADLAQIQLHDIYRQLDGGDLIYAVPATFDKYQLGLVLGISKALSIPVRGVVDAALMAISPPVTDAVIFMDISLHKMTLAVIKHGDRLERTAYDYMANAGLVGFEKAWMKLISELFIETNRYDPLHDASSEQQLFDLLPEYMYRLTSQSDAIVEIDSGHGIHRITLQRQHVIQYFDAMFSKIVKRVSRYINEQAIESIQCSNRVATVPGLIDALKSAFPTCNIITCEPGSSALGALQHQHYIRTQSSDGIVYISSLPVIGFQALTGVSTKSPTHIVYQGIAYAIPCEGLTIEIDSQSNGLNITPPISEQTEDVFLYFDNGNVILDPKSNRILLNRKEIDGTASLAIGDRLHIHTIETELLLISVAT